MSGSVLEFIDQLGKLLKQGPDQIKIKAILTHCDINCKPYDPSKDDSLLHTINQYIIDCGN